MGVGTRLYVRIITTGLHQHEPSIRNLFVSFFAAGDPGAVSVHWARLVFDRIHNPSTFIFNTMIRVSYSAMISRYVSNGRFMEALRLFQDMQMGRVEPNGSVLVSVISASPNLGLLDTSRWVHYYIRNKKKNENMDGRTRTALIDMYCKCGSVDEALRIFSNAKEKALTAEWTAMITGLAMHGQSERAIQLFDEMTRSGTTPNAVTFAALLSACSHGGLVGDGLWYFRRMEADFGIKPTVQHVGCVVDLLGRAGLIDVAMAFMDRYRVKANAAMWGALLTACRDHKNVEVGVMAAKMLLREEPWNGGVYMTLLSLYGGAGRRGEVERLKKEMKEAGCRKNPGCSMIEVNGTCHEFVSGDSWCPLAWEVCSTILGFVNIPIEFDDSLLIDARKY